MKKSNREFLLILASLVMFSVSARAEGTAFQYQGKLIDGANPANGSYQLQFRLFDSPAGGAAVGTPISDVPVTANQGVFSVRLDFGTAVFSGANRFLEISVRHNAGEAYTTLSPREQIASSPYSIRTLSAASADVATNAQQLGGVPANQYLQTDGNGSGLTNLNAGSITTGTLSNARLGQIPTANIADAAVTGPKIANGQVVKSVNGLTDNITLAQGSNITITPAGNNTLTIASTGGGGGVGGSGATNTIPLWSAGTTLGNSLITQSGGTVQLPGFVSLAPTASGNNVSFGNPNSETGMTISGAGGRADLRYNGTLKLLNGPGGIPPDTNGIAIREDGNVGIGTTNPIEKLAVVTGSGVAVGGITTAVSGETYGGSFETRSSGNNSTGVFGRASATGPLAVASGVRGQSDGTFGTGVRGDATGSFGTGVLGRATAASSGQAYGGYFQTSSTGSDSAGVFGQALAGSGTTYGVWGQSESTSGYGVIGISTPLSGTTYGVYGRSASPAGRGAFGYAIASTGVNYGVWGQSDSPAGFDFYAAGAGANYGAASSKRWKSSIEPIGQPLDKLGRLRGVYFNWDAGHGGRHDVGMIAEEVGAVLPEIVNYEENGVDAIGMDYSKLTPLLVEAVNALRAEKDAEIDKLRQQLSEMRQRMTKMEAMTGLGKGETAAVKYNRLSVVFDDAFKGQQKQIKLQQKAIEEHRKQIENLAKIVCEMNSKADICRENKE